MAELTPEQKQLRDQVTDCIKSVLTALGGETHMDKLAVEYKKVVGMEIPHRQLNHGTLASFLQSVNDVMKVINRGGELYVKMLRDDRMLNLQTMIREQKREKRGHANHKPARQPRVPSAWTPAPPRSNAYRVSSGQRLSRHGKGRNDVAPKPKASVFSRLEFPAANKTVAPPVNNKAVKEIPASKFSNVPPQPEATEDEQKGKYYDDGNWIRPCAGRGNQEKRFAPHYEVPPRFNNNCKTADGKPSEKSFKKRLEEEVLKLNQNDVPIFCTVPMGRKPSWLSTLTIGKLKLSSYPNEFEKREQAEEYMAKIALPQIQKLVRQKLPVTTDLALSMSRIKSEKQSSSFKPPASCAKQETAEGHRSQHDPHLNRTSSDPSVAEKGKPTNAPKQKAKLQLPPLEIPHREYLDIFVTHVEGFNCVYFRLIGDEFSGAFDELTTNMELYYMDAKNLSPAKDLCTGGIYAASFEKSWFRVEILNINDNKVKVKFVDHGDEEIIDLTELHDLHQQFFYLPAQLLRCSMAHLENARRDPSALALLQDLALGQTLVGKVTSWQEPISLILFNTITDEDININKKISELLKLNYVEPKLPGTGGIAEVYLMHVSLTGDLFVQIESETYKDLENILEVARKETHGEAMEIDLTRLYLARFNEDGEWYRAVPRSNIDPDGKALQCRLHNVPPNPGLHWTPRTCQRLQELLAENTPLLLKVQGDGTSGDPPSVELFKRIQPQNELVSINATLSMDSSLFSSEGDRNNNSVEKEVFSSSRTSCRRSSVTSQSSSSYGTSGPSSIGSQHDSLPESPRLSRSSRLENLVPQEIPAVGQFFDVFVTFAASPSNFAVQSWKMTKSLSTLTSELQAYYNNPIHCDDLVDIEVGEYYAVKHTDDTWYRAHITTAQEGIVAGLFVDFGDCFVLSQDKVQLLPSKFRRLPCQAIKAKLHGIVAANVDWES
ncbi:tudor domain-containing protein 7B isoform X6 [Procambarus clarkii]|uniref:tudor domain-containing protein 7B isoform X6 n=1 Tax=Procambarus clarkii TaxID=6728 RepID=UPI00374431BD